MSGAGRRPVRAADLKPEMVARNDGYGLVTGVSPVGEGSSTWRVQLAFFVDQDHEFDALIDDTDQKGDSW